MTSTRWTKDGTKIYEKLEVEYPNTYGMTIYCPVCKRMEGGTFPLTKDGIQIDSHRPSTNHDELHIPMMCEALDAWTLVLEFHKGSTYFYGIQSTEDVKRQKDWRHKSDNNEN